MRQRDAAHRAEVEQEAELVKQREAVQKKRILEALWEEEQSFQNGDYIVRQGDETQSLYMIMEGNVRCTAKMSPLAEDEELLMELTAGAYFGERSLLLNMPRAAYVVATKRTTCLHMTKATFEEARRRPARGLGGAGQSP